MLDSTGFDLWADGYDKSLEPSEENDEFPFAGYKDVLNNVYGIVRKRPNTKILDIGFGTGVLTKKLYDDGYKIHGFDFSQKMLDTAKQKMPNANLVRHDFREGLPEKAKDNRYDCIISTYAMHHLDDAQKYGFIRELADCLNEDGQIIIGDIAFETRDSLERYKAVSKDYWDDKEIYFVFDEFAEGMRDKEVRFEKMSCCSGVISISGVKKRAEIRIKEDVVPSTKELVSLYESVEWYLYTKDESRLENAVKNSLKVLTAWDDDMLVGLIRVVGDNHTIIYIQDILVMKEYQRLGIGSRLLTRILEKHKSVRQIVAITDNTEKTTRFYEKNGMVHCAKYNNAAFIKYNSGVRDQSENTGTNQA